MSEKEVEEEGWTDICHKRKKKQGNRPGITTKEIKGWTKAHAETLWVEPMVAPNESQRKKMIAKAVELGTKAVMKNNVYRFKDEIRVQKEGGPIGVKLTGDLSAGYMTDWSEEFLNKLDRLQILWKMYCIYIDDQNFITEATGLGMRYNKDTESMEKIEELVESDRVEKADKRTIETIKEIGNSISDMIKLTADYPSKNPNGRVAMLDLELWIERDKEGYSRLDIATMRKK